jgi:hypothetical protein
MAGILYHDLELPTRTPVLNSWKSARSVPLVFATCFPRGRTINSAVPTVLICPCIKVLAPLLYTCRTQKLASLSWGCCSIGSYLTTSPATWFRYLCLYSIYPRALPSFDEPSEVAFLVEGLLLIPSSASYIHLFATLRLALHHEVSSFCGGFAGR